MLRRLAAVALFACVLPVLDAQDVKSGPQADEAMPGSFQPLNINGPFADRYHCLITEFRLNPGICVFVRARKDSPDAEIDPEVKKLLEAVDKKLQEEFEDTGLQSVVVFLSDFARAAATEDRDGDPKALVKETANREKLVNHLREFAKSFKRLIVATMPEDNIRKKGKADPTVDYRLDDKAEVTVLVYARHRVYSNFAFAEGKLNEAGVTGILKGVDDMLARLKKAPIVK
jgi:hypothetical protein